MSLLCWVLGHKWFDTLIERRNYLDPLEGDLEFVRGQLKFCLRCGKEWGTVLERRTVAYCEDGDHRGKEKVEYEELAGW